MQLGSSAPTTSLLPADPALFSPDQGASKRTAQEGDVLRQQNQSQRQHPQTKHGKNGEDAAQDEECTHGNAYPDGLGFAQPFERAVQPPWKALLHPIELMVEAMLVSVQLTLQTKRSESVTRLY